MRNYLRALVLIPLLALPAPGVAQGTAVLRPGDVVRVIVWQEPDLSGEFTIAPDSTLVHPLYSGVKVAGIPVAEARARLEGLLRRYESSPQFVIEPLVRVAVAGEVRQPSLYSLSPSVTIAEAVALAGGATDRGRLDRVTLVRDGSQWVYDLTDPRGEAAQLPVRSGDRILVARSSRVFRDYIVPAISIVGSIATIINLSLRW